MNRMKQDEVLCQEPIFSNDVRASPDLHDFDGVLRRMNYLPTELLHLVVIANGIEVSKRHLGGSRCERIRSQLFPYIRDVTFHSSVTDPLIGRIPARSSTDEVVIEMARHNASAWLVLLDSGSELPPWIRVAFANSGEWGLALNVGDRWVGVVPDWQPTPDHDQIPRPRKIWDVNYTASKTCSRSPSLDLETVTSDLRSSLAAAKALAYELGRPEFEEMLEQAEAMPTHRTPLTSYAGKLLDERCFSAEARFLFEMAVASWVFGGAGSWTDILFDDLDLRVRYERLTGQLLRAVKNAIVCAVNDGRIG